MTPEEKKLVETTDTPEVDAPKKPYETPTITVHGTVADITQNAGSFVFDGFVGSLTSLPSDRAIKQDFAPVDGRDILGRLAAVPVESWSYTFQNPSVRHIGPMAQDFAAAFGLGDSDRKIDLVDAHGVSVAAIQALYAMVRERDTQVEAMRAELDEIKRMLVN